MLACIFRFCSDVWVFKQLQSFAERELESYAIFPDWQLACCSIELILAALLPVRTVHFAWLRTMNKDEVMKRTVTRQSKVDQVHGSFADRELLQPLLLDLSRPAFTILGEQRRSISCTSEMYQAVATTS
jgi:hypothetical protein